MNERQIFLKAAIAAGCPEDQTRNFVAAKLWLQERGNWSRPRRRDDAICTGRADGNWLRRRSWRRKISLAAGANGADDCQRVPGLKCLLLRKVGKANLEHFEDLRRRLFGRLNHDFSAFAGFCRLPTARGSSPDIFRTKRTLMPISASNST